MHRTPIALGAIAVAGLIGASSASAAVDIDSVEVAAVSAKRAEVTVTTLRGTGAVEPRVTVRLGRRVARLDTVDWDASLPAGEVVTSEDLIRSRAAVGDAVAVRIRICDTECVTTTRTVTVVQGDASYASGSSEHGGSYSSTPLPAGAVTSDQAAAAALAAVPGAKVVEVERTDHDGAVWEVKLQKADGSRVKALIAADGAVVAVRACPSGGDAARPQPAPLPAGAVTAEQASAAALTAIGGGTVLEVKRSRDAAAVWKVEARTTAGVKHEVLIAADGSVVRDEIDS